ncbi:MAG: N-6 DNA methylase, partial [Paludibacteraceae bacterium]|nr:N-6 DNA methylase [Paludibacteraceae bacterium]
KNEFHDYLAQYPAKDIRRALIDLFKVMDTKPENRDPYLADDLKVFPYVNGGLFSNENIEIPQFTDEIKNLLLAKASEDFDWSEISPTIFGAVFESTLNPETRRSGGMHYTSIENIHKVIDPLFLNQLGHEFDACTTKKDLQAFQDKLASLTFFDPACGSGNFLTETYVSLRRLENKVISKLQGPQMVMGDFKNPVKVSIHQFYGIEINDFAVSVATTALWIAELQMLRETERIATFEVDPLPLKTYHNIHEGNALRLDWSEVIAPENLNYIMGNPPFVGHQHRTLDQQQDMDVLYADIADSNYGKLDYVCAWYKKAADYMQGTSIRAALVSTNSICQGESVIAMWQPLFEKKHITIDFAWPTFQWDSESSLKAHVHCVIVGFSTIGTKERRLYNSDGTYKQCQNINGYLLDAPNVFVQSRSKAPKGLPEMTKGSQPTDGGNLFLTEDEKNALIAKYPTTQQFVKQFVGAEEFINNKKRYCLWLKGVSPTLYSHIPEITDRLKAVREMRLASPTASVKRDADIPMLFTQIRQPETNYLIIPRHSSETRRYIPIGYMNADVICGDANQMIADASIYMFGLLTSNVHMSWMRVVCGRLEMRYRYSPAVYYDFPWPKPTEVQKAKIEQTAQAILDARALYPDCSLAELYGEVSMPPELVKAHQENDKAVMAAYGFSTKMTESECVARLLEMYQELTR